MEENSNNIAVEENKNSLDRTDKKAAPPISRKRRKIIIIAAIAVTLVSLLCAFFLLISPKNIAQIYVRASLSGDEKVCSWLEAYDNRQYWLNSRIIGSFEDEDDFFYKQSNIYDADITSWDDFYKAVKSATHDDLIYNYGDYKIHTEARRFKSISQKRLSTFNELGGGLASAEEYGFDSRTASSYKKVTVYAKIYGEDDSSRYMYNVYLAKINIFWKVVGVQVES